MIANEAIYFDPLPLADIPVAAVYRRLRFHPSLTSLAEKQKEEIESTMEEAKNVLALKGVIRRVRVHVSPPDRVVLQTGDLMVSRKLALFLNGLEEALLMSATAGSYVTEKIGELLNKGELARASIFDAVASETTDYALDWLMKYGNQMIRREGKSLLEKRFSPGYGDLGLENQVIFHRVLNLEKVGISVSPQYVLIPEKSVTAITGITEGI